jgi:rhodanese-related sulfurtransferase
MNLENYLENFDYAARKEMKIHIPELLELLKKDKAQFIDIRFKEEFEMWHFSFSKNIPLNELPGRLDEIDKNKIVVTVCPHYDRALIGRIFLLEKGFKAKYLVEGLLGLADYLRGDNAKELFDSLNRNE